MRIHAIPVFPCIAFLTLLTLLPSRAESLNESLVCGYQALPPRSHPTPGSGRHYAPSRQIDLLHLNLDVTPQFASQTITATATLQFKPIGKPLEQLRLDGIELRIQEVTSTHSLESWNATDQEVILTFAKPLPVGQETTVTLRYEASPKKGLYFRTPEMGYAQEDSQLWTQGEPIEHRHWFPGYDFPNEKFTSEITCRVPEGMVAFSNGRKTLEAKDPATGLVAFRWLQDKPHVNYLITLVAGYFKSIEDRYNNVPIAFHTPPSQIQYAARSFQDTKDVLAFLEKESGIPYPWDKYDQVCVLDYHWGGMENTSLTTLNLTTLHTEESETLRSSQGLVAHEAAHQWFGDLVTCKDWSHIWLNEGFATYYEVLYDGHKHGRDMMLYRFYQSAQGILNQPNDTNAIVRRNFRQPEDQFGYLAYPKGSWILHMLRSQVGEDLFRAAIKTYLQNHQFNVADTENLVAVFESLSGRSFDLFFDQYVYHAHHPELVLQYAWDDKSKLAKISVQQTQKTDANVLLFQVDLPVRFHSKSGAHNHTLAITKASEDFYLPLPEAPQMTRIDPELTLLAKIDFKPPTSMLLAQLDLPNDMLGRLQACEQLAARKEKSALAKLKDTLNGDPFFGVRIEASKALRALGSEAAFEALQNSTQQPDARVRQQVIRDLTLTYRESSYQAALNHLKVEKNPDIRSVAIASLAAYPRPEAQDLLLTSLNTPSFRNRLASTAITAMRNQDNPSFITPLLDYLPKHESDFYFASAFSQTLEALASLAREQDDKDPILRLLLVYLNSKKDAVRLGAINALGTLGHAGAIPALESFAQIPKPSQERDTAERALTKLRDSQKTSVDLSRLRTEVLDLQKENRQIRQDFEDLKKRFDARMPAPESSKASTPAKPSKKPKPSSR